MERKTSKVIYGLILTLCLSSCAKPTPVALDCPKIILPKDPIIPLSQLTDESKPDVVIKAWVATAMAYRDWNRAVRKQINATNKDL